MLKKQILFRSGSGEPSAASGNLTAAIDLAQLREYWELTKPRLSMLSVVTAVVGYLAANPARDLSVLLSLLIGTSLAAGACGALNQYLEREADRQMARTRGRPIPSGAISPTAALIFGLVLGVSGTACIWLGANALAAGLTLATLVSYLLVYTPVKRISAWNTVIGAIPGALPPLIGWAAAANSLDGLGWVLFGVLFFWQIPHFMAIAWTYRKDYADGGFVMLTNIDSTGRRAGLQSVLYASLLTVTCLVPALTGDTSWFFGTLATVASLWFTARAIQFLLATEKNAPARRLFFASILHLPLILALLVIDRWLLV